MFIPVLHGLRCIELPLEQAQRLVGDGKTELLHRLIQRLVVLQQVPVRIDEGDGLVPNGIQDVFNSYIS